MRWKTVILTTGVIGCGGALAIAWVRQRPNGEEVQLVESTLGLRPGLAVADVGAGAGDLTLAAAAAVSPGGVVYATEVDPKRLAQIRRRAGEAGLRNVNVVESSQKRTNLPAACCDAMFLRGVYHHFSEPDAVNADLYRALKPGAELLIIDFTPRPWLSLFFPVKDAPGNRSGHGVTSEQLITELGRAGFVVERGPAAWPRGQYSVVFRKPHTKGEGL
jgi:ubiquinone/menaquinone biosynthesis C-methylase UbiE